MDLQNLEKKIAEVIGLEKSSQAVVEKLSSKGLLDKDGMNDKIQTIKNRTRTINGV
jgi:hypothetical protein